MPCYETTSVFEHDDQISLTLPEIDTMSRNRFVTLATAAAAILTSSLLAAQKKLTIEVANQYASAATVHSVTRPFFERAAKPMRLT